MIAYRILITLMAYMLFSAGITSGQSTNNVAPDTLPPSKNLKWLKELEAASDTVRKLIPVARSYDLAQCDPMRYLWIDSQENWRAHHEWVVELGGILREVGILDGSPGRSGTHTRERSQELTLREYEYEPRIDFAAPGERTYTHARIRLAVAHSTASSDVDRVYYIVRRMLPISLKAERGMFIASQEPVGDACFHRGPLSLGFCRGNVIVEIYLSTTTLIDGRSLPNRGDDPELLAKFVQAASRIKGRERELQVKLTESARRIDALLMKDMFTEEVRAQIRAAEHKRREAQTNKTPDSKK